MARNDIITQPGAEFFSSHHNTKASGRSLSNTMPNLYSEIVTIQSSCEFFISEWPTQTRQTANGNRQSANESSCPIAECRVPNAYCLLLIAHSFRSGRAYGTPGYILRMKRLPGVSNLLENCIPIAHCSLLTAHCSLLIKNIIHSRSLSRMTFSSSGSA